MEHDRFWSKAQKAEGDGCWFWTAAIREDGYGAFKVDGRAVRAHRYAWEITQNPIPAGVEVLHSCDPPACIRPAHLFLGTQAVNMADMVSKGRQAGPRGLQSGRATLTAEQITDLTGRRAAGESLRSLARAFQIHTSTVDRISHSNLLYWAKEHGAR